MDTYLILRDETNMSRKIFLLLILTLPLTGWAEDGDAYSKALKKFQETPVIAAMMAESYGYALYPTVGKGGIGIGAAFGNGRVYVGTLTVGLEDKESTLGALLDMATDAQATDQQLIDIVRALDGAGLLEAELRTR